MGSQEKIVHMAFNQFKNHIIVCMDSSVRIFQLEPLVEMYHQGSKMKGTMALGCMQGTSPIIGFVGGGMYPKYADNVVLLFNDSRNIHEQLCFFSTYNSPVLGFQILPTRVVAVIKNEVHVFNRTNPAKLIYSFRDVSDNPMGLLALTPNEHCERLITCFLGKTTGTVLVANITSEDKEAKKKSPMIIRAHDNELACLSLNFEGTLLATASKQGTIIRVWDTNNGSKIANLRRGADPAIVYCINFSGDSEFLCCSSDKGTVHIFAVKDSNLNKRSTLHGMGILSEYVDSHWAVAKFTLPGDNSKKSICAFDKNNCINVVTYTGDFHRYKFNLEGQCTRTIFTGFLETCKHIQGPNLWDIEDIEAFNNNFDFKMRLWK